MKYGGAIFRLFTRLRKKLPYSYYIILLGILVGFCAGLVAVLLKNSVTGIEWLLHSVFFEKSKGYLYFIFPAAGLLLTVLVIKKMLFNKTPGHGIPNVLFSISRKKGIIRRYSLINSFVTSAITMGFGGSAGLEGPTLGTSSAIGSNLGRQLHLDYKARVLLIGCACSGAMASMFKAPVAALVFSLEVIMLDLTMSSLIPLLMASVSAALTSRLFLGDAVLFHFPVKDAFSLSDMPFYSLLGVGCGVFSIYFGKMFFKTTNWLDKIKNAYGKAVVGGVVLGLLIYCMPSLYGEGYQAINLIINGNHEGMFDQSIFSKLGSGIGITLLFMAVLTFMKGVAATVTIGSGGVGGIFAPSLFMGSFFGYAFSFAINQSGYFEVSTTNFTLIGMAGMMSGILHAPLTSIFLIAEITGGYELIIPLMITASISYLTVKYGMENSIYTLQLIKRGDVLTHDKDQAVLTLMSLKSEVESDFSPVFPDMTLGELTRVVAKSSRNIYPVIEADGTYVGNVLLDDIREEMFNREMYNELFVRDFLTTAPDHVSFTDKMDGVMQKFETTGAWNLPVLREGKYEGFVSRSKLFSAYRKVLRDFYSEK